MDKWSERQLGELSQIAIRLLAIESRCLYMGVSAPTDSIYAARQALTVARAALCNASIDIAS